MAAARDQAARILRPEPDTAEGEAARDASADLAEPASRPPSDETVARRPAETPAEPATDKPAAAVAASRRPLPPRRNRGKRKSWS